MAVWGKYRGIDKKGREMKRKWFYQRESPQGGALGRDLMDQKSKSPLFIVAGGTVVLND